MLTAFKTAPRAHQREALRRMATDPTFSLMMGVGTGKSYCIVNDILQQDSSVAVIVAPSGVHTSTWLEEEIPKHWSGPVLPLVAATRAGRKDYGLRPLLDNPREPVRIACVHYEALSTDAGKEALATLLRQGRRPYMVLDESHNIKTPSSQRTRAAWKLGRLSAVRRILSGTMTTKGFEDLYAQYRFLDPAIIGSMTFAAFKAEFCVLITQHIGGGDRERKSFETIAGYQNLTRLFERLAPHTYQVHKEQCLDLPAQTWVDRVVPLGTEQQRVYRQLLDLSLAETASGKLVTADQVITRLLRFQQIVAGHVGVGEGEWEPLPCPRLEACADVVAQSDGKVLVWARFIPDRIQLQKTFNDAGIHSLVYEGVNKDEALRQFRSNRDVKVLIMNPSTGGAGLTINEAPNAVHYSLSFKWSDLVQSEGRNHRDGQTVPVTYTTLLSKGTTDERVRQVLRNKQDVADTLRGAAALGTYLRPG